VETISPPSARSGTTIEDVYEPFLIQRGFLKRTPRGRVATPPRGNISGSRSRKRPRRIRCSGRSDRRAEFLGKGLILFGLLIAAIGVLFLVRKARLDRATSRRHHHPPRKFHLSFSACDMPDHQRAPLLLFWLFRK